METKEIELSKIKPSSKQMRKTFDNDYLKRLAQSIRSRGLLQPITVRELKNGTYEIVHGECRFRAFKKLCRKTIPCFIKVANENDLLIDGLIENLVRKDLEVIDRSKGLCELIKSINPKGLKTPNDANMLIGRVKNWERRGIVSLPSDRNNFTTKEDVFKCSDYINMVGLSANSIVESICLLNLPDCILEKVVYTKNVQERMDWKKRKGTVTVRQAYQLSRLPQQKHQIALYKYATEHHLSLKRTTGMVNEYMELHRKEMIGTDFSFKTPKKNKDFNETIESMSEKLDNWRARLNIFRLQKLYHAGFLQQLDFKGSMANMREELIYFKNKVDKLALDIEQYENEKLKEAKEMKGRTFEVELSPQDARVSIPQKVYTAFGFKGLRSDERRKEKRKIKAIISVLDMFEEKGEEYG